MSPIAGGMEYATGSEEAKDVASASTGRSPVVRLLVTALALLGVAMFVALGVWQLERRVWKLDLIARVEARIHAPVVDAPGPDEWPAGDAEKYEYRHVRMNGRFLDRPGTLVKAVTVLGGGYWVLSPMMTDRGFIVLVNRGFVPADRKAEFSRAGSASAAPVSVTGLLRISEPGGGFLRSNDPAGDRWYSRDIAAIAARRGLDDVAPYFVDAEASGTGGWPRGGLTVVHFRNAHLVYALTWFSLAAMLAAALAAPAIRNRRTGRRRP
jgi:surfeit locus 1 family protein